MEPWSQGARHTDVHETLLLHLGSTTRWRRFGAQEGQGFTVTSHESRVTSHESRVTSHESRVTSHESRVTSHSMYNREIGVRGNRNIMSFAST